jgi:hypothetical protein
MHFLIQFNHRTIITTPTASDGAAASPPNVKLNHCNRRRLPSRQAQCILAYFLLYTWLIAAFYIKQRETICWHAAASQPLIQVH